VGRWERAGLGCRGSWGRHWVRKLHWGVNLDQVDGAPLLLRLLRFRVRFHGLSDLVRRA